MSIQLQNFVSLTTTGTSGASTLLNGVLNVPNYATGSSTPNVFLTNGDQSTTSNLAVNITDLVYNLSANKRYFLTGQLRVNCSTTNGIKYSYSIPTGATMSLLLFTNSASGAFASTLVNTSALLTIALNTNANNYNFVRVMGEITTGANSGNLQLAFASATAGNTSTIYQQGTNLQLITLL